MTLCVLGKPGGESHNAAEGWHTCTRCADLLAGVLADIEHRCATLTDPEELLPTAAAKTGGRRTVPGPRSPAVDTLLAHHDPRTKWTSADGVGALASLGEWARLIREENPDPPYLGPACPGSCEHGSCWLIRPTTATISSEIGTIRHHWTWLLAQPWLDAFASEMRDLYAALNGPSGPRTVRVGPCPEIIGRRVNDDGTETAAPCGAMLRVQLGAGVIRCPRCHTSWPERMWRVVLGDPWIDYAALSELLDVPVGTLWRWCSEDGWRITGNQSRRLVARADAQASYARRRGANREAG